MVQQLWRIWIILKLKNWFSQQTLLVRIVVIPVPELEPRLFSFNNPAGACPTCDGLGVQQFFDESRVVQNESISLAGGAVKGWDRRNFYYYQMLTSLAKHYKFDIETPYEDLPQKN